MIVLGTSDLAALRGKLESISRGEGAFSRDNQRHAENCIDNARELANECLCILDHAERPDYTAAKKCMEDEWFPLWSLPIGPSGWTDQASSIGDFHSPGAFPSLGGTMQPRLELKDGQVRLTFDVQITRRSQIGWTASLSMTPKEAGRLALLLAEKANEASNEPRTD